MTWQHGTNGPPPSSMSSSPCSWISLSLSLSICLFFSVILPLSRCRSTSFFVSISFIPFPHCASILFLSPFHGPLSLYIYIYMYAYFPGICLPFCGLEAKTCLSQLHLIKATTSAKAKKGYVGPQLKAQLGLNCNPEPQVGKVMHTNLCRILTQPEHIKGPDLYLLTRSHQLITGL